MRDRSCSKRGSFIYLYIGGGEGGEGTGCEKLKKSETDYAVGFEK
jgi:hypothetical protein